MKKKAGIRNSKLSIVWLLIMAVFLGEMFAYAWTRMQCIRVGYEITKESKRHEQLVRVQKNLKVELARLKSPNRIAKIATQKLGLVMPTSDQMVVIP